MVSPFEFAGGTSSTVELDSNGRGTISFTVTNVANRRINAITSIRASDPQAREWIEVLPAENDTESGYRSFGVESTQTFDVEIDASSADPGSYTFRLVVADEFDPDENFTESPEIQFTVPGDDTPDEEPSQPPWPLIIGGVVLLVAVIGVIAFFLLSGDDTPRVEIIQETTLYESPSDTAAEVTTVPEDTGSLEVIQLLEDDTWAEVRTEDGETGWVPVATTGGLQGNTEEVARLNPTETPTELPTATPTDTPTPTATPTDTPTPTPTATTDPTCRATVTTNELNFRAGPDVAYDDIGTFRSGESFEVIGRQGNWAQIITPGGEGWIALRGSSGTFAELNGATCSGIPTVSAPVLAQFDAPSEAREGELVSFQNQSLGDIDALQWFFGAPGLGSSNDPNPSVTYDTPGTYTVTLQVRGTDGNTDETTQQIRILATPTRVPTTPAPSADGTVTMSDYSGNRFIPSNFFASEGISAVRAAPEGSYCSDASRATLSTLRGETVLSTGSSSITRCNAVPVEIEFAEPVSSVQLTFQGAETDYTMNVFNTSGSRIGTTTQRGSLSSPRTISYSSSRADIDRITFGRPTAITAVLEIQFETTPTASSGAGTVTMNDYSAGRFIPSSFFATEGISAVRAAPEGSYCSDASRATLSTSRGETVLSTGSSSITRCNAVPVEIEFANPVRSVELTFLGAEVNYTMNVFNTSGALMATRVAEGSLSSPRTISYSSSRADIDRITFGRPTAITAVLEIQFEN